ncbi:MAG: DUF2924 domain-containing protein [Erythrobacter sp.]|nr:DUF2924 domain-containing protein [Erythrobacter sp.]
MTSAQKKEEWRRLMKSPPPPAFGAGLMGRALAYREQERALGGLSSADLKRVKCGVPAAANTASVVKPGTWLSRTWHGEVHQVVVLDNGVEYRGERFASLSAVARRITGTRWSGPRFFGLNSPRLGRMGVTGDG